MDLSTATSVFVSYDVEETNGLLGEGWVLAGAGLEDGYPTFVLVGLPADPVPVESQDPAPVGALPIT